MMPSKAELRAQWDNAPENKVILHQMGRARTRPNMSPFALKLETYLRVAGIDYELDFTQPMGAKGIKPNVNNNALAALYYIGKTPWITFNKQDYSDSQMCMELLGKALDKDLTSRVANTPEQRTAARALRIMMEEHLHW